MAILILPVSLSSFSLQLQFLVSEELYPYKSEIYDDALACYDRAFEIDPGYQVVIPGMSCFRRMN